MIISHKHKFIYIKCRKTAGTSIEMSLSKLCGPQDIITTLTKEDDKAKIGLGLPVAQNYHQPKKEWQLDDWLHYFKTGEKPKRFYHHISCAELIELVPADIWNTYFKFTIERNPFDKVVSFYFWRKAHEKYKRIADFILDGGLNQMRSCDLYLIDKFPVVDKIYQFEDLVFFEKDLTKKLNLSEPFQMIKYKAKSKSRKIKDYRQVLDEEAVNLIKIAFAREIELLGYEF